MSISVELWAAAVPLPTAIFTPAGTFDTYHHLVVLATDSEGRQGWGLGAGVTADDLAKMVGRAECLLDVVGPSVNGLLMVESVDAKGEPCSSDRWSRWAACALSTAGWDLFARQTGVRCADLWAQAEVPADLDCYASGLFLGSSDEEMVAEAQAYRAQGYARVKMRTGRAVEDDLRRFGLVVDVFGSADAVAVDSVNGWSVEQARLFMNDSGPVMWVEDPVALADIAALANLPGLVAAGESLSAMSEFRALYGTGAVGAVLLDVQQVGGPARFLDAARELMELGARIGAHIFTHVSAHLLASIEAPLPLEVFDWSDELMAEPLRPDSHGRVGLVGPGFGVDLNRSALERYGRRVR